MSASLLGCTPKTCHLGSSLYGYQPNVATSGIFITIPILTMITTSAITIKTRRGITPCLLTCLACVLLVAGWANRLAGYSNPWDFFPFAQGTVVLTIAPVFITSSFYSILHILVSKLGPEHSFISPNLYPAILLPHDLVALILQIAGYAIAFPKTVDSQGYVPINSLGIRVVLAGVAIQLATLVATMLFYVSVLLRAYKSYRTYGYTTFHKEMGYVSLSNQFLAAVGVLPLACAFLVGRSVYRIITLAGGMGGQVSRNQSLFVGVEGLLVAFALLAGVLCHPGIMLWGGHNRTEEDVPFVPGQEAGNNLEEMGKVYKDQDAVLARNTSVRAVHGYGTPV